MTCAIKNNISYFIYGTIGSIAEVRNEQARKTRADSNGTTVIILLSFTSIT